MKTLSAATIRGASKSLNLIQPMHILGYEYIRYLPYNILIQFMDA